MSGFAIGFFILFNIFTEWNTIPADQRTATRFKRGCSTLPASSTKKDDEERQSSNVQDMVELSRSPSTPDFSEKKPIVMSETFTWQHVSYTVPIGGGQAKKLLDDISGYVSPGKLTALMGASGAGKVSDNSSYTVVSGLIVRLLDDSSQRSGSASRCRCCLR